MREQPCTADIEAILARRHDNGADLWATPDGRLMKGSPFTTLDCAVMLPCLGMPLNDPVLQATAELIFSAQRADGRFKVYPKGSIFPCHTINAARALCHLGRAGDARLQKTFDHLLEIQHEDGGWRCQKFFFGRGPETLSSNPGPTLSALDAFRFTPALNRSAALDRAVEFLLRHWETRAPLGPCHYGIGTLFMQVAFPFLTYNLFHYVHTLSFYDAAKGDPRFREALRTLQQKLQDGQIVVERPNAKLQNLSCCKKGQPSALPTMAYREILENIGEGGAAL
jgi:hypothetical protein